MKNLKLYLTASLLALCAVMLPAQASDHAVPQGAVGFGFGYAKTTRIATPIAVHALSVSDTVQLGVSDPKGIAGASFTVGQASHFSVASASLDTTLKGYAGNRFEVRSPTLAANYRPNNDGKSSGRLTLLGASRTPNA